MRLAHPASMVSKRRCYEVVSESKWVRWVLGKKIQTDGGREKRSVG